jgi:hypothetical protein
VSVGAKFLVADDSVWGYHGRTEPAVEIDARSGEPLDGGDVRFEVLGDDRKPLTEVLPV